MRTTGSRTMRSLGIALVACLVVAGAAFAHHGWSDYDASKTLNLTGVIQESKYSNPHGVIRLQVEGEKGKTWLCILAPTSRMTKRGLTAEMLKEGMKATVVGYPHRERPDEMRAERITVEGKTVELR